MPVRRYAMRYLSLFTRRVYALLKLFSHAPAWRVLATPRLPAYLRLFRFAREPSMCWQREVATAGRRRKPSQR